MSEVQTLKNLDGNKESMIAQLKEEIDKLQSCLVEKENLYMALLLTASNKVSTLEKCWRLWNLSLVSFFTHVLYSSQLLFKNPPSFLIMIYFIFTYVSLCQACGHLWKLEEAAESTGAGVIQPSLLKKFKTTTKLLNTSCLQFLRIGIIGIHYLPGLLLYVACCIELVLIFLFQ